MEDSRLRAPVSHQNVRLGRGKHLSPREGACVVEVASMLAGEPFSDRPSSVCPMVAAYMRALNDLASDEERKLLWPYAAAIVGSAGEPSVLKARTRACVGWLQEAEGLSWLRTTLLRGASSFELIGERCARRALAQGTAAALGLADRLLELGRSEGFEAVEAGHELAELLDDHVGRS